MFYFRPGGKGVGGNPPSIVLWYNEGGGGPVPPSCWPWFLMCTLSTTKPPLYDLMGLVLSPGTWKGHQPKVSTPSLVKRKEHIQHSQRNFHSWDFFKKQTKKNNNLKTKNNSPASFLRKLLFENKMTRVSGNRGSISQEVERHPGWCEGRGEMTAGQLAEEHLLQIKAGQTVLEELFARWNWHNIWCLQSYWEKIQKNGNRKECVIKM